MKIAPAFAMVLLAIVAGMAAPRSQEEDLLRFEQREADWALLHIWVPSRALAELVPEPLIPTTANFNPLTGRTPEGFIDVFLFVRSGSFAIPIGGKQVRENGVVDLFLAVAVETPQHLRRERTTDLYLLEYYCNNQPLATLLAQVGIQVHSLSGGMKESSRPDLSEQLEGELELEEYGTLELMVRTTERRRYDTGSSTIRLFFAAGDVIRALEMQLRDDFYMRAASSVNFLDKSPLDRWQDWRWADDHTTFHYSRGTRHIVRNVSTERPAAQDVMK